MVVAPVYSASGLSSWGIANDSLPLILNITWHDFDRKMIARIRDVNSKVVFTVPIFCMGTCAIIYITPEGSYKYTIVFENTRACVDRSRECKSKFAVLGPHLAGKGCQEKGKKKKFLHVL